MTRVAHATGASLFALVDAPLHEVLYEGLRLDEQERHARLRAERDALHAAVLTNLAVNAPDRLKREYERFEAALWAEHRVVRRGPLTAEERARVAAMVASLHTLQLPPFASTTTTARPTSADRLPLVS